MINKEIQQLKSEILEKLNLPEEMNGNDLRKVRQELGITALEFAYDCGWQIQLQRWIEDYEESLCHTGFFDKILTTLVLIHIKKFGK
jgi:hypothetical protein